MADIIDAADQTDPSANPAAEATAAEAPVGRAATNVNSILRRKVAQCRRVRRELTPEWSTNIDYLRAKPFDSASDQDRIAITADWSNTKRKKAQLFSQVPKIRLKTRRRWMKTLPQPARIAFQDKVNDEMEDINVGAVMDECASAVINAAGICGAMVSFERRVEDRDMQKPSGPIAGMPILPQTTPPPVAAAPVEPEGDEPPAAAGALPGAPPPPQTVAMPYTTAKRFDMRAVSPADLLWDVSFTGSDWNKCPLVGESGRMHWGQAIKEFGESPDRPDGLTATDKEAVCGKDDRNDLDRLSHSPDRTNHADSDLVSYDQVFYRRFYFDENETSFEAIQRVVFVRGRKGKPVIDELWKGQKRVRAADGTQAIVGSCKFPIQIGTLTYITDEAIPPSDSAMGRPQIDELSMGRGMMMAQRRFSLPWRWFNNNLVPPEIVTQLMRGEWQGAVPLNGSGDKVMGEIARANYPREDFEFDRVAKAELDATWNLGTSLSGGGGGNTQVRSAAEADAVQGNMNTVIAMDRAKMVKLFCNLAEVLAGMMALYADFTEEEQQAMQTWDREKFASYFLYTVRADASVLLDARQRLAQLERFWNQTAKSGMVDEVPILQEMASLNDIDEAFVHPPGPPPPPKMNISLRLGAEELDNPIFVAMLMQTGQFPDPQALNAAKQAIIAGKQLPDVPVSGAGPEAPMGATEQLPHPPVEDRMPQLNEADRVNKRTHDGK